MACELPWERLMAQTRYGRYADAVETTAILYALHHSTGPGVVLDVGCEGGRWSRLFAERGWRVEAMDTDVRALQICKQRIAGASCTLLGSDTESLPLEANSIDVALCIEVGPVIHSQWAVYEFARVLKSGGRLVGVCWNRHSWRGFLYHYVPALRKSGSHPLVGYPIKYGDFRREMTNRGFRFEKEEGYAWGPFRRTSNSRLTTIWGSLEQYSGLRKPVTLAPMIAFVCQKSP